MILPRINLLPYAKRTRFQRYHGLTDIERFRAKIYELPSGCWIWTSNLNKGYGRFWTVKSGLVEAHRWSYEYYVGPIPDGLQIDHLCRVHSCVNPQHLEPVTQRENALRGYGMSGIYARRTHCKNGHEYTPENTHMMKSGRWCRTCDRETHRKRAAMKKAGILERVKPNDREG